MMNQLIAKKMKSLEEMILALILITTMMASPLKLKSDAPLKIMILSLKKKNNHQILFGKIWKHLMNLIFLQQLTELDKIHGIKLFRR